MRASMNQVTWSIEFTLARSLGMFYIKCTLKFASFSMSQA